MKNKTKYKFNLKNVIVLIILAALVVGYFISTSNATSGKKNNSEYDKIMSKDFDTAYPATPKEVVKMYSRIVKCMYNTKLSDKKVEKLTNKLRELFDQELLDINPISKHLEQLESDIKSYQKSDTTIISYIAGENSTVKYSTVDGAKCATILIDYTLKTGTEYEKPVEKFVLRQAPDEKWKIVGWVLDEKENVNKEE